MDVTINTVIDIGSPDSVSTSIVATPSFCCVMDDDPDDATAMSVCIVGEICNSLAILVDSCAPSSNRMLALDLLPLAIVDATAVLGRQAVLLRALQHEASVRSPCGSRGCGTTCSLVITVGCFRFVM